MSTTWTKIPKAVGTAWTKAPKPSNEGNTITGGGQPIGLLLALTYTTVSPGAIGWIKVPKASGTAWTKIPKAT